MLEGREIAPRFVAHITANRDRTIGFMVEKIEARSPTVEDFDRCKIVLSKLHSLGITHGRLDRASFLIDRNGTAVLHGFGSSYQPENPAVMDAEMATLREILRRPLRNAASPWQQKL
jgi:hypothetical protein